MKKKEKELISCLPDYIQGRIEDANLKDIIENELRINHSLKKEYDEIKNAMAFLNTVSLKKPSETYFNSLLPRINRRIEILTPNKSKKSFISGNRNYWRYLIPVIPVLIIILIYRIDFYTSLNRESEKNKINIQESLRTETGFNRTDTIKNIIENSETNEISTEKELFTNDDSIKYKSKPSLNTEKNEDLSFDEYDFEDQNIFINEDDVTNEEKELFELDEKYQNEILNDLKNEKL